MRGQEIGYMLESAVPPMPGALRMMSYNPPQIREGEDAICSGVVESHGAGCWAREASKMTAAPTAISTCGEQQQSA